MIPETPRCALFIEHGGGSSLYRAALHVFSQTETFKIRDIEILDLASGIPALLRSCTTQVTSVIVRGAPKLGGLVQCWKLSTMQIGTVLIYIA